MSAQPWKNSEQTILVTGAAGQIGAYLVRTLVQNNYRVRALSSRRRLSIAPFVDWREMDWRTSLDFDRHVEGCAAVVHLGVEKNDVDLMPRVNISATAALADASASAGVKLFCHVSSVSVHGTPLTRWVDEESPLVSPDRDVPAEHWAAPVMRAYARSKVAAERLLAERPRNFHSVILRPTIVRSRDDIRALAQWNFLRKFILAGRLTHTLPVEDMVHAILWFLQDRLDQPSRPPQLEIYNIANNDPGDTYAAFFEQALALTGDPRFRSLPHAPAMADLWMHWWKFRTLARRWPMGLVQYSAEKLLRTGYRPVLGSIMACANAFAPDVPVPEICGSLG